MFHRLIALLVFVGSWRIVAWPMPTTTWLPGTPAFIVTDDQGLNCPRAESAPTNPTNTPHHTITAARLSMVRFLTV
ncbi:MAG: hypothetical protein JW818_03250 [Pirellulales bacterium]|nr:hypothetical protein [Pirellulales bacterium]